MHDYQLKVDVRGRGEPVVVVTGAGGSVSHLSPLAEALSSSYRVLVPSFPGDGGSAVYPAAYSTRTDLALLESALRAHGVENAHVIGFSGGVYRSFALATAGKIHVRSIIGLGGYANLPDNIRDDLRGFAQLARAHAIPEGVLPARMLTPAFAAKNPAVVAEIEGWVTGQIAEGLAQQLDANANCEDLTPRLSELRAPIYLRAGQLDIAVPVELSRQIVLAAPHAALDVVPGVAHALLAEDFEETLRAIRRVLAAA